MAKFELANDPDLYYCVVVMCLAVCTTLISEGLSWVFIYRTQEYKDLKREIDAQTRKIEKKKLELSENRAGKGAEKKVQQREEKLKDLNQRMSKARMKSMLFIAVLMIVFISSLSSAYQVHDFPTVGHRGGSATFRTLGPLQEHHARRHRW